MGLYAFRRLFDAIINHKPNPTDSEAYGGSTRLEPRVECPYCEKPVFSRSLYGHVAMSDGGGHGPRGEIPEDYRDHTPEVIDHQEFTMKTAQSLPESERVRCKHCGDDFSGWHGLKTHLAMKKGDAEHPEEYDVESSGVRVRFQEAESGEVRPDSTSPQQSDRTPSSLNAYQAKLREMRGEEPETDETVPVEVLETLLDEYRMREGEAGGFYKAAKMLEQVIRDAETRRRTTLLLKSVNLQ